MTEDEARRIFVEQVNALADHAAVHGPAPDSESRMAAVMAKHRAAIARMKREERTEREQASAAPGP